MLIYVITFLLFSGVLSVVTDPECFVKLRKECDPGLVPRRYPDTIEELDTMCRETTAYGKCALPVLRECDEPSHANYIEELVQFLETRCDKENPTYKAITSDLTCVVDAFRLAYAGACSDRVSKEKEAAVDKHKEYLHEKGMSQQEILRCLDSVWENACTSALVSEKCGSLAGNAVLDIGVNLDHTLKTVCSEEVVADLPIIAEGFLIAENGENILESLIRRRK